MIADLKPYAEYKESGLPWLDKVPAHWEVRRLRASVSTMTNGLWGSDPNGEDDVSCVRVADFDRTHRVIKRKKLTLRAIPRALRTGRMLQNNDLLLEKSGGGDQQPVGFVVMYDLADQAICSNFISRIACADGYHPKYLNYLHATAYAVGLNVRCIKQTTGIQNLDSKAYLSEKVAFPPTKEQTAIVRFLDWANGRLERAIRAKRKVIALLNEQKQAIIHRAVTRGLDPAVPLKLSGIPWLGDIPHHWDVLRAKYIYREMNERSTTGNEELLSVSHITGVTPRSQKSVTMFKAASYVGHKLCRPGDLAVNTMWAWMGALGVSTYEGIISPGYAVYRPIHPDRIIGQYMDGLLRSRPYISNIICRSTGLRASRLRLYPEDFFRLPIVLPPTEEQCQIVRSIESQTAGQDANISRLEREISLLKEYSTRLVADVVTGKLDVREAAAKLPVEEQTIEPEELVEDDSEMMEDEIAEPVG